MKSTAPFHGASCWLALGLCALALPAPALYVNPIIHGADPYVVHANGFYYFLRTTGGSVEIRRSTHLQGVAGGTTSTVFGPNGIIHGHIWAPELHFLNGKWYVYATGSVVPGEVVQRLFVLEANTADPMGGYTFKGVMDQHTGQLDATVLTRDSDGAHFIVYSQWDDAGQSLYLAPLANPWTFGSPGVRISTPDHPWERNGWVNEGPIALKRGGKTFIVYSASGTWTPDYCLGLLQNTDGNYTNAASWTKLSTPVFARRDANHVYCVGHNGFTRSPSGAEDWIIYHATSDPTGNQEPKRNTRIQKFIWNSDHTPNFDVPFPTGVALAAPEEAPGTPIRGLRGEYFANKDLAGAPVVVKTNATLDFNWGTGAPAFGLGVDNFSVRWSGMLYAPDGGAYTFQTAADDGIRLWVNGQLLMNDWNARPLTTNSGSLTLDGGQFYSLRMEYFENVGGAVCRLNWNPPGGSPGLIPPAFLFPSSNGLRGDYFNGTNFNTPVLTRIDPAVDFNWGAGRPEEPVNPDNFSVRWTGRIQPLYSETYTFHAVSDDGVRLWIQDQLLVNHWTQQAPTTNSGNIALVAGQLYDVTMEFFEGGGEAMARLEWSSASQARQVVPQGRLFLPGTTQGPSLPLPQTWLTYHFDDGTLQGWTVVSGDSQGRQNFGVVPPGTNSPNTTPQAGSHFIGLHIPAFTLTAPVYTQDSAHNTLWLRSPEFTLNGAGHLTAWLSGGNGYGADATGKLVANVPAHAFDDPGNATFPSFLGIALRNVDTGVFVLARRKANNGNEWEQVAMTQAQLAALDQNAVYTLDLLDVRQGGWGWVNLDSVSIPGTPLFTEPPALTIRQWADNQVRITWPASAPGFTLQRSADPGTGYTNADLTVVTEGDEFVAYDALSGAPTFYRLSK